MQPRFVDVLVFDGLADWEIGHALAHLNDPKWQQTPGRYVVRTCATSLDLVRSAGGLVIRPDVSWEAVRPTESAMLILPGGTAWDAGVLDPLLPRVAEWIEAGVPVAAICGATAGLARAGLLNTRAHTSNTAAYLQAQPGYTGQALYRPVPIVAQDGLITASSLAPIEFARDILRELAVYAPAVLDHWYQLFSTGEAQHFFALMQAVGAGR